MKCKSYFLNKLSSKNTSYKLLTKHNSIDRIQEKPT
jgi:hypothetical protein